MARLTTCCCFSVRTGALILAILGTIGGGMSLLSSIGGYAMEDSIYEMMNQVQEQFKEAYDQGQIDSNQYHFMVNYLDTVRSLLPYSLAAGVATALFDLAIFIMLLVGILYKRHCLLLPYLILQMIGLVLLTIVVAAVTIIFWVAGSVGGGFAMLIIGSAVLALGYYLWTVVQSVYLDIKEQGENYNTFDKQPIVLMESQYMTTPPPAYAQLK